ncbi:MAG TPA: cyclase [Bacteroidales bacterium]|nr:MAG: cyclase [Nitrospirae bacterium GWA2_42_11]OGW56518.1 MAG: cyclase [Nitrospirae bacterium RIFCSPLOW2_12_42_9]HAS17580.1 cyclase [Nitrospiraceae bacterium]HBH85378.1 cyclase [Bacteroidales bacterium]
MHIYDITLTISPDLPVWPGDPPVKIERVAKIEEGANSNLSRMSMGVHTGTHVDAPLHFLTGGNGVESLPLNILIGRAYVLNLPDADIITASVLKQSSIPTETNRLIIKTRNSQYLEQKDPVFRTGFVGISADGAEFLVGLGIKLIGIDYLSVAPYKQSRPTHEILLKSDVVIVEGLDLSNITQGQYTLYCLPLKIAGCDGAPARAILVSS